MIETGWACLGGKARGIQPTIDFCSEICGDGLVISWHTCDDGNLADGDGCTKNCITEPGYNCKGGGKGSCLEICGDGKNLGILPCDD